MLIAFEKKLQTLSLMEVASLMEYRFIHELTEMCEKPTNLFVGWIAL